MLNGALEYRWQFGYHYDRQAVRVLRVCACVVLGFGIRPCFTQTLGDVELAVISTLTSLFLLLSESQMTPLLLSLIHWGGAGPDDIATSFGLTSADNFSPSFGKRACACPHVGPACVT